MSRTIPLLVFTISLFVGLMCVPLAEGRVFDSQQNSVFFTKNSDEAQMNYLNAVSPYDYGYTIGQRFTMQYRLLHILFRFVDKQTVDGNVVENHRKTIEQYCPYFLEELRGLSASTAVSVDSLILIMKKASLLYGGECTAALATENATKNNETFLLFNMDSSVEDISHILLSTMIHRLFSMRCWVVRIRTMEYRYAFWGIPILLEYPFLNEKGLGWCSPGTIFTTNASRYIDTGEGMSTMMLERLALMTCANVSEVAWLYTHTERASPKGDTLNDLYDSSSSCFCDREGGILCIEQTHKYCLCVFGNSTGVTSAPEGMLWHANHHQWLDPNQTGSVYPSEYPSSSLRAERIYELMLAMYGNITVDKCMAITRDHAAGFEMNGKDSGDICRHPDQYAGKITAFSWIIMPKDMIVYWTHTSPCRGSFVAYDFSHIF
jgi:hypothetical protein